MPPPPQESIKIKHGTKYETVVMINQERELNHTETQY